MSTMNPALSLADFFAPTVENLAAEISAALAGSAELKSLKSALADGSSLQFGAVVHALAGKFHELLDIRISTLLVKAWNQSREIRKAIEKTRLNENETALTPLLDHTIKSEHSPHIDLVRNDKVITRLVFPVKIDISLKGIILKIRKGAIQEACSGEIQVKGTLSFGEYVILSKEFQPYRIAGSLPLENETTSKAESATT